MLIARIYGLIWLFVAAIGAVLYLTGYLSPIVLILFGKIFIGLIFMGLIGLLPLWAEHQSSSKRRSG